MTNDPGARSERRFPRMTLNERIQHVVMMTSFFTLVLTGFPITFPDSPISSGVVNMLGGFGVRSLVHRFAACILMGLTVYHLFYVAFTRHGRSQIMALIPKFKDGFDALHMLKFYVGLAKDTPKFDRFNFIEKFEYLALAWGSMVMIGTGLMLWFQDQAMIIFPKWALDVAKVVHGYEAILAFLAIIIWHFYHVHLNPEVFPMSRVWIDGDISEHEMMTLHPLEYERIMAQEEAARGLAETATDAETVLTTGNGERKE